MATKNIDVIVRRPAGDVVTKVDFTAYDANDVIRVPRRTPFLNIKNLAALKANGFLRTNTTVSTKYGGDNTKDAHSNLGLTLPRTEKLILLAKSPSTTAIELTISGNTRAGRESFVVEIPAGTAGDIHEIDLYDLGFFIESDKEGSATITTDAAVGLVLIARF
jgi:hypothetical protein